MKIMSDNEIANELVEKGGQAIADFQNNFCIDSPEDFQAGEEWKVEAKLVAKRTLLTLAEKYEYWNRADLLQLASQIEDPDWDNLD